MLPAVSQVRPNPPTAAHGAASALGSRNRDQCTSRTRSSLGPGVQGSHHHPKEEGRRPLPQPHQPRCGPAPADPPQGNEAGHDSWLLSAPGWARSAPRGGGAGPWGGPGSVRGAPGARGPRCANGSGRDHRAGPGTAAHPARYPSRRCRHLAAGDGTRPAPAPDPRLPPAHRRRSRPRPPAPGPALPLVGPQRSLCWVRGRRPGRHLGAAQGMCVTYNMRAAPPRPSGLLWGCGARVRGGPRTAQGRGLGRGGTALSSGRARAGAEPGAGG